MVQEKLETILIIEDDPGVATLQQRRLERAGFCVVTAENGDDGMEQLADTHVDLVLLDFQLPDNRTGLDFYAQMKATGHHLPVIVVTGYSDESTVIQALRAGVRDFVTKSAEYLDYLPEAVNRVLHQVRLENRLSQSEARLAGIVSSAMDAILTVDSEHRISLFNAAAEQIFRCSAEQAIAQPIQSFIPSTIHETSGLFNLAKSEGHLCATWYELRGVRADGEKFPLEASVSSTQVSNEQSLILIIRDITDRKRAEERLREQALLLDRATNAIFVRDLENRIQFWNRGAQQLFGWTAEEAIGKNADELLFDQTPLELAEARQTVMKNKQWDGELRKVTKESKEVLVSSQWTLMYDEEGQPKSILSISTDITEKKNLEKQFLRAQRMESIGTLAGGIAHDLNNILSPIMMSLEMLGMFVPEHARESLLEPLTACTQRGAQMVKQILSFARGMEGKHSLFQPRHLVRDLEKMIGNSFPKSIAIETDVPKDLSPINGDATQIYQVLMNLCVNARDAMPEGGNLTITGENVALDEHFAGRRPEAKAGPYVLITVSDTGTGIPPDILDRVFDPFFTTKEIGKGTGLGLSSSLGIIKSHGGFVDVASKVENGTRISVYFPACKNGATRPDERGRSRLPKGHGELILVVEDEPAIRNVAKATLESNGYRVLTANNGAAGVDLFAEKRAEIQAVLLDMMMPVMAGPATIRALLNLDPHVPIIAMSGFVTKGGSSDYPRHAVKTLLRKPFSAEELLTTLGNVINERTDNCGDSGTIFPNNGEKLSGNMTFASFLEVR